MNRLLGILVTLAIAHGLLYAFLIPPWQAPDEIAHFEYSRLLAERWRPLGPADASPALEQTIIDSLYRYQAWNWIGRPTPQERPNQLWTAPFFGTSRTLGRFSTAYLPYAAAILPFLEQDIVTQLYIMRCVSVILGAVVVVLAFQTARLVAPDLPELALGSALFLVFLPQHAFIMAAVSDGNLAEGSASLAIYLLIKMWREGLRWPQIALGLAATLVAVLAKSTAYFLLPLLIVLALSFLHRWWGTRWRILSRPGIGLIGLLSIVIILAVWGLTQFILIRLPVYSLQDLDSFKHFWAVLTARGPYSLLSAVWGTFKSYWLTLGWMSLSLPEPSYYLLLILSATALIGLVIRFRSQSSLPNLGLYLILGLSASLPIVILFVSFFASALGLFLFQGRYLFGGITAQALVLVIGWLSLVPHRYTAGAFWALTSGLLFLDVAALGWVIIPFYYK